MISYQYDITATVNDMVNLEKLDLEIRASTLPNFITPPYMFNSKVYIDFAAEITAQEKTDLAAIIAAHDGSQADIAQAHVDAREKKIRDLTEMAVYHPALNNDDVVEYLTSIDNWFNAWKRCGIDTSLVAKIAADSADVNHPQYAFLTTDVNTAGDKTFEFLIGMIQS